MGILMSGICFAASPRTASVGISDEIKVTNSIYKVNITETSTDGRDVSVAGPFYHASYTDDNGSGDFDYYGNATVGNNGVVTLSTHDDGAMTVVQVVIISKTYTAEIGTSAGIYIIPITSDATIKIIYQLGSGRN